MHVSFLFKNSSESKIITENMLFKNTYSRKFFLAKYFEEANLRK